MWNAGIGDRSPAQNRLDPPRVLSPCGPGTPLEPLPLSPLHLDDLPHQLLDYNLPKGCHPRPPSVSLPTGARSCGRHSGDPSTPTSSSWHTVARSGSGSPTQPRPFHNCDSNSPSPPRLKRKAPAASGDSARGAPLPPPRTGSDDAGSGLPHTALRGGGEHSPLLRHFARSGSGDSGSPGRPYHSSRSGSGDSGCMPRRPSSRSGSDPFSPAGSSIRHPTRCVGGDSASPSPFMLPRQAPDSRAGSGDSGSPGPSLSGKQGTRGSTSSEGSSGAGSFVRHRPGPRKGSEGRDGNGPSRQLFPRRPGSTCSDASGSLSPCAKPRLPAFIPVSVQRSGALGGPGGELVQLEAQSASSVTVLSCVVCRGGALLGLQGQWPGGAAPSAPTNYAGFCAAVLGLTGHVDLQLRVVLGVQDVLQGARQQFVADCGAVPTGPAVAQCRLYCVALGHGLAMLHCVGLPEGALDLAGPPSLDLGPRYVPCGGCCGG